MYFECNGKIYKQENVAEIDVSEIEDLKVRILLNSPMLSLELDGMEAINYIYRCYPNALEGKRLKWIKHRWFIHNFFGHPVMQLLAFFRCYKLAIKIHDCTIPKPIAKAEKKN